MQRKETNHATARGDWPLERKGCGTSHLTRKFLFAIVPAVLLLACSVISIPAQDKPAGSQRTPRATPTPSPTPLSPLPNSRSKINQAGRNLFDPGIFGVIRWKAEYGLPSIDGGRTPDKATNCTAIRVQATVQEGAPSTFGKAVNVGYIALQNEPTEESGYYICSYSITDRNHDLPRNRVIAISAFLGPYASAELNQALITGRWFGAGGPQPPPGDQRVVIGGRGITLADSAARATVDFEMVYRPVPAAPR
jgi:hypothetical protein